MINSSKAEVIKCACLALEAGSIDAAKKIIAAGFPFSHYVEGGHLNESLRIKIFRRDGFVDRYSCKLVLLPPVLGILSKVIPDVFPYQKNWKYNETHQAYQIFCASVDKVIPSGSSTDEKNLVTTSYSNRVAKAGANLEDIGWQLHTLEEIASERWDGMSGWFVNYINKHKEFLNDTTISKWYKAIQS